MTDQDATRSNPFPLIVGGCVLLYFGFFGLIILDEVVFRTYWFSKTLPELKEPVQWFYTPITTLFHVFAGR